MDKQRKRNRIQCQAPDCQTSNKRSFFTKESALFFKKAYNSKRTYLCPDCGFWHLTSK